MMSQAILNGRNVVPNYGTVMRAHGWDPLPGRGWIGSITETHTGGTELHEAPSTGTWHRKEGHRKDPGDFPVLTEVPSRSAESFDYPTIDRNDKILD